MNIEKYITNSICNIITCNFENIIYGKQEKNHNSIPYRVF